MIEIGLALMIQAAMVSPSAQQAEITVTARRLHDWRGRASVNAKGSRCKTVQTTGDKDLDQIGCDTMRHCMATLQPQADATAERKLTRDIRNQRIAALNKSLTICVSEQHQLRVADLIERRAAARIRTNASN